MRQWTHCYNHNPQTTKNFLQDIFEVIYIDLTKEPCSFVAFGCYRFKMFHKCQLEIKDNTKVSVTSR